jgi:hypothetical protein
MNKFIIIFFLLSIQFSFAETTIISLSQKVPFKSGDSFALRGSNYTVQVEANLGSTCAVPGFNCGSGYIPPHSTFKIKCENQNYCPYILMAFPDSGTSGHLSIENELSCEQHEPALCFREMAKEFKTDDKCMRLKSSLGKYYCLQLFPLSARSNNLGLCDELPNSIFALRWNCYYEYAIKYKDLRFCDKYSSAELSGKERCLLKMAEILKDKTICEKITLNKENSYREQCQGLK